MELSMDVLVFCNDAILQRYSPNTWLKILSKLTSFFFSRYLCITLRTLKTEEEPVNSGRHFQYKINLISAAAAKCKNVMFPYFLQKLIFSPPRKPLLLWNLQPATTPYREPAIPMQPTLSGPTSQTIKCVSSS